MVAIIILLVVIVLGLWYAITMLDKLRAGLAPAISTPQSNLKTICQELSIEPNAEVWELGCGDARVISYCARNHPEAKFIGIENGLMMFLRAKWRTRQQSNITIRFGNIKLQKLGSATNIYLYLLPEALAMISSEIPRGCRVVSLEFRFPKHKPIEVVRLNQPEKFAHKLYIYSF